MLSKVEVKISLQSSRKLKSTWIIKKRAQNKVRLRADLYDSNQIAFHPVRIPSNAYRHLLFFSPNSED